jgi:peptidoglycan/xylan/chitin deacetylase (PgdA/CDA1 family)
MRGLVYKAKGLARTARRRLLAGNRVFLTIDDGPLESFPAILDLLDSYDAKATFFLVASRIDDTSLSLVHKALINGHKIGNHSWSHRAFSKIREEEIEEEILKAHELLDQIVRQTKGKHVQKPEQRYFRFPWLDIGVLYRGGQLVKGSPANRDAARKLLNRLGYKIVGVDIESRDWAIEFGQGTVDEAKERILKAAGGDIILMHDRSTALEILEGVLPKLTRRRRMATLL